MKFLCLLALVLSSLFISQRSLAQTTTAKPWTYWWWMGSAVNERDITHQLEQMAGAGLGGVHVIPIYGVKGEESKFIPFLSNRWLAVFAHTVREANRLGMGVDLSTGTGWPFGGPNVTPEMVAQQWKLQNGSVIGTPTKQQVKRPAPGGAGPVLDPFSKQSVQTYLRRFDSTLTRLPQKPRAVYNDSYEVYGANWTTNFGDQFRKRRGYDLLTRRADFLDSTQTPAAQAVRRDYHETLSDLLRDEFTATWTGWAKQRGYLTRHQAHGSPGNLIDLYALADIPETESFGSSQFPIPGLRVDPDYEEDRFGTPHPLAMKFASSAAHLLGKPLVSSETTTWLANHFKVSLSQIKPQIDELFTAGINHVFYHGTTYSPPSGQAWPGWLFYASTNYGPSSHNWPHLPLLNEYVTRCQTRLQATTPDNDLLVYFPIHDLWSKRSPSAGGVHLLEVHHVDRWLLPMPFGKLCDSLRLAGYSFDYVSDSLLHRLMVGKSGEVTVGGASARKGKYRAILVPSAEFIPEQTRQRLAQLTRLGVRVIYNANLPKLAQLGIRREEMAERGLSFMRKKGATGTQYFVANLNNRFQRGWVTLGTSGVVGRYEPLTDQTTIPPQHAGAVWLDLPPGASCFLTVKKGETRHSSSQKNELGPIPAVTPLYEPWQFQFVEGVPALTQTASLSNLVSWTTLADSAAYFWGKGRYKTTFNLAEPVEPTQTYQLDLGDVREVAEVRLNGQTVGTAWSIPFRLELPTKFLKLTDNQLEITVWNLSANYMRLRDTQKPDWKHFYDINMVDITYRPFDASRWPAMPSGLLGPVRLLRVN